MSTSLGWKGNRRSGVALAMRHHASQTIVVYPLTGSTAYEREMSIPPTLLRSMALFYLYLYYHRRRRRRRRRRRCRRQTYY